MYNCNIIPYELFSYIMDIIYSDLRLNIRLESIEFYGVETFFLYAQQIWNILETNFQFEYTFASWCLFKTNILYFRYSKVFLKWQIKAWIRVSCRVDCGACTLLFHACRSSSKVNLIGMANLNQKEMIAWNVSCCAKCFSHY